MAFQVRTTRTANAEIELAYSWLKERNPVYADKWFRELMDTIATLQKNPRRCALAPENDSFTEEIRQLIYGKSRSKYRILFAIREDTVFVLHVRHSSQASLTIEEVDEEKE
ncbi:type II toxin-antitoxin system RelE/ParE family toxin [Nostocaceae cyanobacterium CENA369]|jgi:plasmid stabilization system protein ParE|uniref:Type II toxin-antitoxin system RelE/ParE family toxin n=1 Tax=Dendronalium phyllosphericum CENA369 TaxID=1725256 RepID=A0A8J7HWV5_9NOST|nr:type II toxin-antitoxin system RelE/ParE family toxin [Dendronalium phyllosphericum]MBH8571619.1 type II toxin-antitoxin system RelE/ParE family toxin [Dendronalium phyllosphericum CENA369]